MKLRDKAVIISGAGRGIGAAMARRFAEESPRGVVVADLDGAAVAAVASSLRERGIDAVPSRMDVTRREQAHGLVEIAEREFGAVDLVCSNAGVATGLGVHASDDDWSRAWSVNVLGHVYLAQAALPGMVLRRGGHLLITASAAGLLGLPGDAPYSVTKHAAVGLAEWLAFTYRPSGVGVSTLCPLGVRTELLMPGLALNHPAARAVADAAPIIEPADVADAVVDGLADDRFLILPHGEVGEMYARRAADPQEWVAAGWGAR
ncbi:NADP-dependent 3-hydroxy acid dehydrogenase YdfG [Herbihabitans rhizosphaerae]|uniref:NADP-dependent 3-hydroxy acid dehydrogenase YdfG n=1 Tax=Herbihabitans rhizosphaerae TaxID=1872711 RepID=A0A4Q7KGV2_9PSEU|nr:SDR family oxidoreductase [Herbihabitans rhizosphaerae]RZS34100.1 NADP-dependent 3-hydroxy acid dehydrogenase YdfG [Herbihabitans rhizosphaerae]